MTINGCASSHCGTTETLTLNYSSVSTETHQRTVRSKVGARGGAEQRQRRRMSENQKRDRESN